MANDLFGSQIIADRTGLFFTLYLEDALTGDGLVGITPASSGFYAAYLRQGGGIVQMTPGITITANNTVWMNGQASPPAAQFGWREIDATNWKGHYRLDLPNACWVTGANWVKVVVFATGAVRAWSQTWGLADNPYYVIGDNVWADRIDFSQAPWSQNPPGWNPRALLFGTRRRRRDTAGTQIETVSPNGTVVASEGYATDPAGELISRIGPAA